ncbi:MAG: type II toxin-antitoxin system VapC family toxin [Planctomycetes bacterium]|nr:type II toxin-antitoxin system VapC family toxin [Planctomycetota bacterium]
MLFDTDVLIWVLRGNEHAARAIEEAPRCLTSIVSYMELLQGARDRKELRTIRSFLSDCGIQVCPLTENIGHRGSVYMEEHVLASRMSVADAMIAATAVENRVPLCTSNRKHYRQIGDLEIAAFRA